MRVEIDIRRPRWIPARFSRRWKLFGAALVACVVVAPIGVLANDKFNDVPFGAGHDEVSQVAGVPAVLRRHGDHRLQTERVELDRLVFARRVVTLVDDEDDGCVRAP